MNNLSVIRLQIFKGMVFAIPFFVRLYVLHESDKPKGIGALWAETRFIYIAPMWFSDLQNHGPNL
ncbi:hypothetical protein TH19_12360 [Thalassospira profundimaris]|uniref:Uncharacterized protein n=1 Tax=Thalassospira profundimaris TaxID=502049 RepID=A0A367W8E2_9PROT|nr:hypothetical protein TH19_12360 [Thalassospira profundimaris]